MQTHQLKRIHENKKRMIVARGGRRGKTSGRGGKGQTARAGNKRRPEWRDIIKRLPKLRGRGKNSNKSIVSPHNKPVVVNLKTLENLFSASDRITPISLMEKGIVSTYSGRIPSIKILGEGELTKVLNISGCAVSKSAKIKIEKAGGSVLFERTMVPKSVGQEPSESPKKPGVKNEKDIQSETKSKIEAKERVVKKKDKK